MRAGLLSGAVLAVLCIGLLCGGLAAGEKQQTEVAVAYFSVAINPAEVININRAAKADLMTLPGIGETLAERIISYRDRLGGDGFHDIRQLLEVEGIGQSRFNGIKFLITV